jgi:DNA-binding CsgD family transcriptional regulator
MNDEARQIHPKALDMYLSPAKTRALSGLMEALAEQHGQTSVRECIGQQMLTLLDADQYASFVWNEELQTFGDRVAINMSDTNLSAYETYFQFRDPITRQLQQRRGPTLVEQVMPQEQLVKTEFFNDFLRRDGLYWGVNLYAWDGARNIGDMRIWRSRRRDRFDADALELLALIQPAFVSALRRSSRSSTPARNARPAQAGATVQLSNREFAVAGLVSLGISDKEIAKRLGIGFPTVRTHVSSVFRKVGVDNRVQLATRMRELREACVSSA